MKRILPMLALTIAAVLPMGAAHAASGPYVEGKAITAMIIRMSDLPSGRYTTTVAQGMRWLAMRTFTATVQTWGMQAGTGELLLFSVGRYNSAAAAAELTTADALYGRVARTWQPAGVGDPGDAHGYIEPDAEFGAPGIRYALRFSRGPFLVVADAVGGARRLNPALFAGYVRLIDSRIKAYLARSAPH